MNTRHLECARASFEYQQNITQGPVRGYRLTPNPTALLHRWYTLVREKRASRQDFLKTMTRAFDLDSTKLSSTQDEVDFIRYMAENISAFDYKTNEEVLTVIRQLTTILSVVGMALVETIAPTTLSGVPLEMEMSLATPVPQFPTSNGMPFSSPLTPMSSQVTPTPNVSRLKPTDLRPAHDGVNVQDRARCAAAVGIILLLKVHLKTLYGLTEDKCSKWVPGKKSALGDKPTTKKREIPLVWDGMPHAVTPIRTDEDAAVQNSRFLEIWADEPVTMEPDEDPMEL